MKKWVLLRAKTAMLLANIASNAVGVCVVLFLSETIGSASSEITELALRINRFFVPCSFLLPVVLTLLYERPIRSYLTNVSLRKAVTEKETTGARRRLLNEPFFLIALDMGIWLAAAVLYAVLFSAHGADGPVIRTAFLLNSHAGLITTTVAFFVFEFVMQRRVVPYVFPEGSLSATPGTIRIRIRVRLVAFLFACNIIPFLTFLYAVHSSFQSRRDPVKILEQLQTTILSETLIFMGGPASGFGFGPYDDAPPPLPPTELPPAFTPIGCIPGAVASWLSGVYAGRPYPYKVARSCVAP